MNTLTEERKAAAAFAFTKKLNLQAANGSCDALSPDITTARPPAKWMEAVLSTGALEFDDCSRASNLCASRTRSAIDVPLGTFICALHKVFRENVMSFGGDNDSIVDRALTVIHRQLLRLRGGPPNQI